MSTTKAIMTNTTKQAVNRFLGWKLPNDFRPDAGIEFSPSLLQLNSVHGWPTGTNLFTADQARAMFEYCLQDTRADLVNNSHMVHQIAEAARCLGVAQVKNDSEAIQYWTTKVDELTNSYLVKPVQAEPVAQVDANDDEIWVDILPDSDVKVDQMALQPMFANCSLRLFRQHWIT